MNKIKTWFAAAAAILLSFGMFAEPILKMAPKAVLLDGGKTLTFVYDAKDYGTKNVNWFSVAEAVAQSQTIGTYKPWKTAGANETVTKVEFDSSFASYKPTNCYQWFRNFSKLATVAGIENLDVSEATNLGMMFAYCSSLTTLDLAQFDTANVTSIYAMFFGCQKLVTIYASDKFVTSKLTTSTELVFDTCTQLVGGNKTSFNSSYRTAERARVDKVDYPGYFTMKEPTVIWDSDESTLTFYFKPALDLPQGSSYHRFYMPVDGYAPDWLTWNAQSVIFGAKKVVFDSSFATYRPKCCLEWFYNFVNLTDIVGLNYLNVSRVSHSYGLWYMFANCSKLTMLDLSNFDTRKVAATVSRKQMFEGCSALKTIYATDAFEMDGNSTDMFKGCSNLNGGNGTVWSGEAALDKTFAKVDREGDAGYFTAAPVAVFDDDGVMTLYADGEAEHDGTAYSAVSRDEANLPPWFNLHNEGTTKIVVDSSFADYQPKSCRQWFENLVNVKEVEGLENIDLSETEDMYYMFYNCANLKHLCGFGQGGVKKVKNLSHLFESCTHLESVNLMRFETASVTNMVNMFQNCTALKKIYVADKFVTTGLNPSASSQSMFSGCDNLSGGKGTTIYTSGAGSSATYARIDGVGSKKGLLSYAPVASVKDGVLTFRMDGSEGHEIDETVGNEPTWQFDRTKITKVVFDSSFKDYQPPHCSKWFFAFVKLNEIENLQYLDTSKATDMSSMFSGCWVLKSINLAEFNTANVTNMSYMFGTCKELSTLDLSSFSSAKLQTMAGMFNNCEDLEKIYASADFSSTALSIVEKGKTAFDGCDDLKGANGATTEDGVTALLARIDSAAEPGLFSGAPVAVFNSVAKTLTFYADGEDHGGTQTYSVLESVREVDDHGGNLWYSDCSEVTKVVFDDSFKIYHPANCTAWFNEFSVLTQVTGLKNLDVSDAEDLTCMFCGCSSLTELDLSTFDTESVEKFTSMFAGCTNLVTIKASADFVFDSATAIGATANMFKDCSALKGGRGTQWASANKKDKTFAKIDIPGQQGYFTGPSIAVTDSSVTFATIPDQTHTGSAIKPAVTMTYSGVTCTLGTDYTVAYANNIEVGTATATVTGIGCFAGTKLLTFNIVSETPDPDPDPDPTPTPDPDPVKTIPTLFDNLDLGDLNAKGATYNGFIGEETLGGTFTLVVKAPKKGQTVATATMTLVDPNTGKKVKVTGTVDVNTGICSGNLAGMTLGAKGLSGTYNGMLAQGSVDAAKAKDTAALAVMNGFNKKAYGLVIADEAGNEGMLTATFSTKGKVKIAGTVAGNKVSGSTQMSVGDRCAVPFAYVKKNVAVSFVLWFDKEGNLLDVSGLGEGVSLKVAGLANAPAAGVYVFAINSADIFAAVPNAIAETPVAVNVTWNGKKFDAGKAATVKYDKTAGKVVVDTKKGDNVSGLTLKYSKGALTGSFTVYGQNGTKVTKNKFTVSGIVVDGVGYATATAKKLGAIACELAK